MAFSRLVASGFLITAISWIAFFGTAYAGLFSFLGNVFGGASTNEGQYNSQTIPLLSAPGAPEADLAVGGADLNLVDGTSLLPVVGPLGSIADVDTYKLEQITLYTVHEGDTFSKIADMFGISVNTIYWANNLKQGDVIKAGDSLVILPISGVQYQIKKGDTLKSIAAKLKGDESEIALFNNLPTGSALEVGTTIIIPDAELSLPSVSSGTSGSKRTSPLRGAGGPDLGDYFMRPIDGGRKTQGLHGFNGVDLADSIGTPVYAAAGGTVIIARSQGWNGGYGKYIAISHPNGTQTVYAHLSSLNVSVGQLISRGYQIGNIGTTGNSTGPHLHFEIRGAKNPF